MALSIQEGGIVEIVHNERQDVTIVVVRNSWFHKSKEDGLEGSEILEPLPAKVS